MKKSIKILLILLGVLVILGGLSYFLTGHIIPSYSCGSDFSTSFAQAVNNNDTAFCSDYSGAVRYSKDPIYGKRFCSTQKLGKMTDGYSIRQDDFKDSCLEAMAGANANIEACKQISGYGSKISCILEVKQLTGNKDYCNLITDDPTIKGMCLK